MAIVTDAAARATYRAEVENWGDRLHAAGVRLCRWFLERGGEYQCGEGAADSAPGGR